ncbi:septal ring lytic transglycosylase RlpA family protein [Methylobacterium persicinum]|uniref:Endolytic peptidoglycan transglycosylase RlpA n=1 Tax=Methylobacterium persicinum TaxID=374426 RepID=A0ABU0HM71_9HYPH|nr:septal ring lytic transglycosylase RlpA family protein [Methylobacterium persicinum]MDQ0443022.1 rare lipoprotein A [Methylobacterium persicinum]GJE39061.1 Endolytic peptidoglycan transglycosylase RlpA [Methylobacterium persicinum]
MRMTQTRPGHFALRFLAVSAVALATANCASNTATKLAGGNGVDPKYGVKASPRLYNEGDVIPKGGGRRYTGKPYVVAGETYTPKENPRGYVREGLASWYGSAFHGRMTANGEVFDRHSIAAAHPTLPLPSYARVTNLDNGSSMIVRVNDRGPYHAGRVMDVSEEAAEALGFHRKGTAHVRVEYVGKAALAGSDDRKLMATLRTDGRPAGSRSSVMVADLGPSEETEGLSRGATPLAYKPAPEPAEEAPRRPVRAPIVLASAAVAVPAAVQPTAVRTREFKPAPVQTAAVRLAPVKVAGVAVSAGNPGPLHPSVTVKAASGRHEAPAVTKLASAALEPRKGGRGPVPAAMPESAKLAMARLATQAAPAGKGGKGKESVNKEPVKQVAKAAEPASRPTGHGARYAGIY